MATAGQVLKAALQRILVQASDADLEPDEYADAMFAMNNLMTAYDAEGIYLGYTEVTTLADTITIPAGALRGLIANVAIEISPDYNGAITDGLRVAAKYGKDAMRTLGVVITSSAMPSTLPIGSGNTDNSNWSTNFYSDLEAEILAETTGAIGLETGTVV